MSYFVLFFLGVFLSTSLWAVEGYKDIYLDREKTIRIHSIYCGKDLKNLRALKNSFVYTNSEKIEKGTYYYSSAYGDFSYTFNVIKGQNSENVMLRGLLTKGKTQKQDMQKEVCIVGKIAGLPAVLNNKITVREISVDDPEWDKIMVKYAMFGKPAFAKGVYVDQRTSAKQDQHNQRVFDANQVYLKSVEKQFKQKYDILAEQLKVALGDAIKYAHQEDGFLKTKVYPVVDKPSVWTPAAKQRYEDLSRRAFQEKEYDQLIQQNFDWFFKLTGKENSVKQIKLIPVDATPVWNKGVLQKKISVAAEFSNGKTLQLDFQVKSEKVDEHFFDSMEKIKKQADALRHNALAFSKKTREPVALPQNRTFKIYDNSRKVNLFFSDFRDKSQGDNYRYF